MSDIDRGMRAQAILTDPLFIESFDMVRQAILNAFEASPARDGEGREHLFQRLKALNDAKGYLEQAMNNGKVALHLREEKKRLFNVFNR